MTIIPLKENQEEKWIGRVFLRSVCRSSRRATDAPHAAAGGAAESCGEALLLPPCKSDQLVPEQA